MPIHGTLRTPLHTLILAVATSVPALAADIRVPRDHQTIQGAVSAAGPGDTIIVARGTYRGPVTIPSNKSGLKVRGVGQVWVENDPTVPESGSVIRIHADDVGLSGLGIRHGGPNSADPDAGGVHVTGHGVRLDRLRILHCDGAAMRITGTKARVLNCEIRGCDEGILVLDSDALVAKCTVRMVERDGIRVDGRRITVKNCRVERAGSHGIQAIGATNVVRKNRVTGTGGSGIKVTGAENRVIQNTVRWTGGDGHAIEARLSADHTLIQPTSVRGNRCSDADGAGIWMSGEGNGEIIGNRVSRCGTGSSMGNTAVAGIVSYGKPVLDNTVEQCAGDGIYYRGNSMVAGNRCLDNLADGLFLYTGSGAEVRDNLLRGNQGEGFQNGGSSTVFVGNTAMKNRLDVADTGSFAVFSNNRYRTGGPDQSPEVD